MKCYKCIRSKPCAARAFFITVLSALLGLQGCHYADSETDEQFSGESSGEVKMESTSDVSTQKTRQESIKEPTKETMEKTTKKTMKKSIRETMQENGLTRELSIHAASGSAVSEFPVGEAVVFELTLKNTTAEALQVSYTPPMQQVRIFQAEDEQLVWDQHHGQFFIQAFMEHTIEPNSQEDYSVTWKAVDNDGNSVAPGRYLVKVKLAQEYFPDQIITLK